MLEIVVFGGRRSLRSGYKGRPQTTYRDWMGQGGNAMTADNSDVGVLDVAEVAFNNFMRTTGRRRP